MTRQSFPATDYVSEKLWGVDCQKRAPSHGLAITGHALD